ncbi:hypothetical protein [Rhodopirellula bahusiensis]|uniref:hypothetical protein n=1 Tax=Rhodopirellula bahusiensis TaxID=2014065 RepID=UPI0032667FA1
MQFQVKAPQAFVKAMTSDTSANASSSQRSIDGVTYTLQYNKIGWDTGNFAQARISPENNGLGKEWFSVKDDGWDAFQNSLVAVSKPYNASMPNNGWRIADTVLLKAPSASTTNLTLDMTGQFLAEKSLSEQTRFSSMNPQIVAVPMGSSLAVGYQAQFKGKSRDAEVAVYEPSGNGWKEKWSQKLPLKVFGGITTDGQNVYALSAIDEDIEKNMVINTFRMGVLKLTKFDATGQKVWEKDVNNSDYMGSGVTELGDEQLAVYSPFTGGTAQLAYGNKQVAVIMACNTSPDRPISSRHQRAIMFTVNADGSGSQSFHETSFRHSFDQRVVFDGNDFVYADIGDTGWYMPAAGITMRKGKPSATGTKYVPEGVAEGVYIYARHGDQTSHSNFSFTSLGDVVADATGYGVLFASQKKMLAAPANGFSTPIQAPHQLAFVHVAKAFETAQDASETHAGGAKPRNGNVTIDWTVKDKPKQINITSNVVDSVGDSRGFWAHPSKPSKKFNQHGVIWLTQLANGTSAERPKMVRLSSGQLLAMWEEWTYDGTGQNLKYQSTKGMLLSASGRASGTATTLSARLNPSGADRAFAMNDKASWVTGRSDGGLWLHQLGSDLLLKSVKLGKQNSTNEATPNPTPQFAANNVGPGSQPNVGGKTGNPPMSPGNPIPGRPNVGGPKPVNSLAGNSVGSKMAGPSPGKNAAKDGEWVILPNSSGSGSTSAPNAGSKSVTGKALSDQSFDVAVKKLTDAQAGGYRLVYDADLARLGDGFAYAVDNSSSAGRFTRIGFLLELTPPLPNGGSVFGDSQKVFVTMNAFTTDVNKISFPIHNEAFQQSVESMEVQSNVMGIHGTGTGSIEFFANDYLPGDDNSYNKQDQIAGRDFGYGSMQVFNQKGETVFAINGWGNGQKADIGIGQSSVTKEGKTHTDWTFANNADTYSTKRLRVYVK